MEKFQTLGRRAGALFLDSLVLLPVSWIVSPISLFFDSSPTALAVSSALVGVITVAYSIVLHALYGQTLGKKVARVKVVDTSEKPINFGQSVLRSFPQLILAMFALSFSTADETAANSIDIFGTLIYWFFVIFFIVDIVICLVNEKRRALHDFMGGTIVVRTDV
jgi:uncharacterized RDD family membrane protein YckC